MFQQITLRELIWYFLINQSALKTYFYET